MQRFAIPLLAVFVLTACSDATSTLEPIRNPDVNLAASQGGAPAPIDVSFVLDDGPCSFDVLVEITGKEKVKFLPNGLLAISAPGEVATITNQDTGNSIVEGITGTIRVLFLENDDAVLGLTGRSLVETEDGLFLTIGNFSLTVDINGNSVVPLAGTGSLINVCELLS